MKTTIYFTILAVMFGAQLILCWKCNRVAVRFAPIAVTVFLMVVSFVFYAVSNWTNWAWLIIIMLEFFVLLCAAVGAIVGGILRKLEK